MFVIKLKGCIKRTSVKICPVKNCLVPSLVTGTIEIREAGYYIVRGTVIEIAPYMEQDDVRIQTDPYKLESEPGKTRVKVIED